MSSYLIENKPHISLREFLQLPEVKPSREYFEAQISEKPMPQGKHSRIQTRLATAINQVGEAQKLLLAFTELRCTFAGVSLIPDIVVFEWQRIPLEASGEILNRFDIPPDWVIEILSPDQSPNQVLKKIIFCLEQGTKLAWFIDPQDQSVMIFQPNQAPQIKSGNDILPVLDILSQWQFTPADLFGWLKI